MLRSILEILYLSSIIYISFLYYKLFLNVVKLRRKLERAIRAHANFCETVPLNILISFILYFNNLIFFSLLQTFLLATGRTLHAKAISNIKENINMRRTGMRLTNYSLFIGIIGIVSYMLQLIYFNLQYLMNTT